MQAIGVVGGMRRQNLLEGHLCVLDAVQNRWVLCGVATCGLAEP